MQSKSFHRRSAFLLSRQTLMTVLVIVFLIINLFPVAAVSASEGNSTRSTRGMTAFYFRGSSQLSKEGPTNMTPQRITVSRTSLRDPWPTVGEWSYSVPEYRAEVKGTVAVTYTLINTGLTPVPNFSINFTLKGTGIQIVNHTDVHPVIPALRARTSTASFDINSNYIMRGASMALEVTAFTASNNVQFVYDSTFYDSSLEIDYARANYPPSANAGPDIAMREGDTANLMGTGSDVDGQIVQYEWDFEGDGIYDWASALGGSTTHRYDIPGVFIASMRVMDDDDATAVDTATITVQENQRPTVTINSPGNGDTVNASVVISGTASDGDGMVDSVWVRFDNGMWHRAVGTENWALTWDTTLETNGVHIIAVKSNDSLEESPVSSIQVNVNNVGVNPRPVSRIVSIAPNPAFKLDRVSFEGDGEDDGSIITWSWTSSIDGALSDQRNFTTTSLTPGNHTIYLKVRDDNGSWSNSDSRLLIVKEYSRPKQITDHSLDDIGSSTIFDSYGVFWCAWSSERDGNSNIYVKSSVDGVQWSSPIRVTDDASSEIQPALIQLQNRTYVVVYASDISGNFDIYLKYSHWGGYWSDPVRTTNSQYDEKEPAIYQPANGKIFVTYSVDEPDPIGISIRIAHGNNIFSLSNPVTVTTGLSSNRYPSLVEESQGNMTIVFSSDRTGNFEIWKTIYINTANFTTPRRITYTVRDNFYPCVLKDVSSMYRLAFSDDTDSLYLTESIDMVRFSEPVIISTDFTDNADPYLLQDADGHFWVTWDSDSLGNKDVFALSFSGNSPPHAVITTPADGAIYFTSETITFDGRDSYDPNGAEELSSYTWRSDSSGVLSTQATFSQNLGAGMHNITLTVGDIHGAESVAEVTITVTQTPNKGPTADAGDKGATVEAKVNQDIRFDGSDSSDPDSDTLTYKWDFESDGIWDDLNKTNTHSYNASGSYVALLMVEDPSGANDTDVVNVSISNNKNPVARIIVDDEDKRVNVNTTVGFDASGSTDDDDTVLYYSWDFNGDGIEDSKSVTPTHKFTEKGVFTVNLTVMDPFGGNNTVGEEITVNKPPVAVLVGNESGYVGEAVSFSAVDSYDEDGDELRFDWDFESDGELDEEGAEVEHIYDAAGEYTVLLWVLDGRDGKDTAEMDVVIAIRNTAPLAEAGEDIDANLPDDIQFSALGSYDPEDDINGNGEIDGDEIDNLTYSWDMGDGKTKTGFEPTYSYEEAGEFEVRLTVTDPSGETANDTLTVAVNTPPVAQITLKTAGLLYDGDRIAMSGEDSTDEDGDTLKYSWDFDDSDGEISEEATGEVVEHRYDLPGEYVITLTVDDDNGGISNATLPLTILESEQVVELDEPSIEITSPSDKHKYPYKTKSITVECNVEGEYIQRVVITLYNGDNEEASVEITEDFDEISETFSPKTKNKYRIFAQIFNDDHPEYAAYYSINISFNPKVTTTDDEPVKQPGVLSKYGIWGGAAGGAVIVMAVLFLVVRKRKRSKVSGTPEVEPVDVEVAEVIEAEEEVEVDIEKLIQPLSQPILCPKCGKSFNVDDYGKRPLEMKCPHCGAGGKINTPVPPMLTERIEKALAKQKAKTAEPVPVEIPEPPAALPDAKVAKIDDLTKGVKIRCPKCDKGFTTTSREDIVCPHCGAKGDIPEKEFEKLRRRQGAIPKMLPPAPAPKPAKGPVKKVSKKEVLDKLTSSADKVECPKCSSSFLVEKDAKRIKCPSCGVKGKMG